MRKVKKKAFSFLLLAVLVFTFGITVRAKEEDTIKKGIFAGEIELSGKTAAQAEAEIEAYVEELQEVEITLLAADENEVVVKAGELGMTWVNQELVAEAVKLGRQGNVVQRYKALKDLEHENKVFDIELEFDMQLVSDILADECTKFDREAVDVSLERKNGEFRVVDGQIGYVLNVEASADKVYDFLTQKWNHQECSIPLEIAEDEPKGSAEELAQVTDVLGSFTTSYTSSGSSRSANVANGADLINGITLYPGEEFSTYEAVAPFTQANGYYMAGSYMNGKVVDSLGGGICQVSTTLYNTVLLSELEVTERHNHSMIVSYVEPSADAAIAESSGKDFKFVNNTDYPIYIESFVDNKRITVNIYGKETRSDNRKVRYESEILEINNPVDVINADASQPVGYINVLSGSAHVGYKARLWKVVTENGVEVSREQVNSSSYKMTPRIATVGIATEDAYSYNEIMAAIGTANIDHVRNVIAILQGQNVETAAQPGE